VREQIKDEKTIVDREKSFSYAKFSLYIREQILLSFKRRISRKEQIYWKINNIEFLGGFEKERRKRLPVLRCCI